MIHYTCGCGFETTPVPDMYRDDEQKRLEALKAFVGHYQNGECECSHTANTDPMACHECGLNIDFGQHMTFKVMIQWPIEKGKDWEPDWNLGNELDKKICEAVDFDLIGGGAGSGFNMRDMDWVTEYVQTAEWIFDFLRNQANRFNAEVTIDLVFIYDNELEDEHWVYETETLNQFIG